MDVLQILFFGALVGLFTSLSALLGLNLSILSWLALTTGSSILCFLLGLLFLLFLLLESLGLGLSLLLPPVSVEVAKAYLAFIVLAEAVNYTVLSECNTVMFATLNINNIVVLEWLEFSDFCWIRGSEFVANTQLTVVVHAPGKNLVLLINVEAVVAAYEDVESLLGSDLFDFHHGVLFSFRQLSTEFARFTIAPSEDLTLFGKSQGVLGAGDYLLKHVLGFLVE